jgi:hypothetical protein
MGDPGLPGPTGIRGGFGERVSFVDKAPNDQLQLPHPITPSPTATVPQ